MTPAQKILIKGAKTRLRLMKLMPHEQDCIDDAKFIKTIIMNGIGFEGMEPTDNNAITKAWKRLCRPKTGECFHNAQSFVIDHPEAEYFEGLYSVPCALPFHHAWVLFNGKLFDFTIEATIENEPPIMRNSFPEYYSPVYRGLPVPMQFFAKLMAESGPGNPVGALYYLVKNKKGKKL